VEHQSPHPGASAQLAPQTIVAAATPAGRGGIGIVRISGLLAPKIAEAMLGRVPDARLATRARFTDAEGLCLDEGLALYFEAPASFTGEHVLELHGHGGPVVLESLIERAVQLGARRAQPGEFTQRAYLNGKLDLAQAEAVADLIDAGSQAAARAAIRSLQGEFSARIEALAEQLTDLRAYVEAAIDFPEEEIDFLADAALHARLAAVRADFAAVETAARQGRLLNEGLSVVIAGPPNAGKSTLLNSLAGYDAAIVTPIAGTTRDVLRERVLIGGVPVQLLDTAGLRDSEHPIESEGIRRAHAAIAQADRVLFIVDAATDPAATAFSAQRAQLPVGVAVTLVLNKIDLAPQVAPVPGLDCICISARTGQGVAQLREHLLRGAGFLGAEQGSLSARARHLAALAEANAHLESAAVQLTVGRAGELAAEELRRSHQALGLITGQTTSDELLGRIFASFCVGK
jgi:tRNA modification GTPase